MSGIRQGWLVARRELRERSRSKAFRLSSVAMILAVVLVIVVPTFFGGDSTSEVGLAGTEPAGLARTLQTQGEAAGTPVQIHRYGTVAAGERAVRDGDVQVLIVDARRLEWPQQVDDRLKAEVTSAIQAVEIQQRAARAGMTPAELAALLTPVPTTDVTLGVAAGRSPDDQVAAMVMTVLLLMTISIFGGLVLTGVVEEKSSRVVEVLLSRIPARALLAGKVVGIGLLGLAQIAITAVAALIAVAAVGTDLPSVRPAVLAWMLAWFVLGYALYATAYGVLGSLASRTEDAQSVSGPVTVVLSVGYVAALIALNSPDATWATVLSLFPPTAPLAMPGRIALGVTAWWEPLLAAALTLVTVAGLIRVGGRMYVGAVLHAGAPLSVRAAWRSATGRAARHAPPGEARPEPAPAPSGSVPAKRWVGVRRADILAHRMLLAVVAFAGVAIGATVALVLHDVVQGVIIGALVIGLSFQVKRLWTGHGGGRMRHP